MLPDIEAVLALLPEMFPGAQMIPLQNIRPNPQNPGAPLTDPEIQDLAQNIAQAGLLNPLKVQPDRANPWARDVQLHPSNPRLQANGKPWAVDDFNYVILAGENRYRAFGHLKRDSIPGFILNPTAKEAVKITHLDNAVRDRGWWADYQSIEQLKQADREISQRQIGVELKMDNEKVYRALRLFPLLNAKARALLARNAGTKNKGKWGLSERAAALLADLGDAQAVEQALRRVVDDQMTEAQAKALVAAMKAGTSAEAYTTAPPKARVSKAVGSQAVPTPNSKLLTPNSAQAGPGPDLHSQVGAAIASHELGKKLHMPSWLTNRMFAPLSRLFHWTRGLFAEVGIKDPTIGTVLTILLFFFVASKGYSLLGRLVDRVWNGFAYSHLSPALAVSKQGVPALAVPTNTQDLTSDNPTPAGSTSKPSAVTVNSSPKVAHKATVPSWVSEEVLFVQDFAMVLFDLSPSTWDPMQTYFLKHVDDDYLAPFLKQFYPVDLLRQMQKQKLVFALHDANTKFLRMEGSSGVFLVQGTWAKKGDGINPTAQPVTLLIQIQHHPDGNNLVEKVTGVSFDDQAAGVGSPKGEDPLKAVGDGVNGLNDAVNKAGQANSDIDKAKDIFGR